jgi:UDPglucose 6-dehydrogenase
MRTVCIVGLWHQGIVAAACLARCGVRVRAMDPDADRIAMLQAGRSPIFEPGLDELIAEGLSSGQLSFSTHLAESVGGVGDILLTLDTPVDENDQSDLSGLWRLIEQMAPLLGENAVLYVTAQVPVGTCATMALKIREMRPGLDFGIAYSPENLRLGQAIERFLKPALPVIGADEDWVFDRVTAMLEPLGVASWMRVSVKAAEMTKHALNAFLATCVTFGNELGNLCDETGVDAVSVVKALRMEERVGSKAMLMPGLGFSGGTLARDLQTLREIGKRQHLETPMLDGIWSANLRQNGVVKRKMEKLFGNLKGVTVAVLGLTYKPGTSTLRRSASLAVIADLVAAGAVVTGHDPKADSAELATHPEFTFTRDVYAAAQGRQALILMTAWNEYRDLDMERMMGAMAARPVVLDTANLWDAEAMDRLGFRYYNIGRGRKIEG